MSARPAAESPAGPGATRAQESPATDGPRFSPAVVTEDPVNVLEAVLNAHDDNDSRLDGAFNGLSPEDRRRFREKYRSFPPENRNRRGIIVYILGKNPVDAEDWAFLREVVGEPPCLSLSDCARAPGAGGGDESEVTLAYPALVALKQAERVLEAGPDSSRRQAQAVVREGMNSRVPVVAEEAARLSRRR